MPIIDTSELSERELDILKLVATGASNKEIGQKLFISSNTVKVHLRNIFNKINVTSRTEAAMFAVRTGLVSHLPSEANIEDNAESVARDDQKAEQVLPIQFPQSAAQLRRAYPRWMYLILVLGIFGLLFWGLRLSPGLALFSKPTITQQQSNPATPIPHWRKLTNLPGARADSASVAYENMIYLVGGITDQGVSGDFDRFDPQKNSWEALSPKPTPVYNARAAVINGLIYIPGGLISSESGQPTNILEIYDTNQDSWHSGSSLPVNLSGYGMVAFEGNLYVFGGWDGQDYQNSVYSYNPGTDEWLVRTPMPTARAYPSAVVAAGKIYIIGGESNTGFIDANEIYTPSRDHDNIDPWSYGFPIPEVYSSIQATTIADTIYIFGTETSASNRNGLIYFPQSDSWQSIEASPEPLGEDFSLASISTNLFFMGGKFNTGFSDQNISYQAVITLSIPIIIK